MSIGRAPKSSPPGNERRTWPQRVSSGPSTLIDARIRSTSSYGATGVRSPLLVRTSRPRSGATIDTPIAPSSSPMIDTSTISGTLPSSNDPSVSSVAAISFSTEFLAPGTTTSPASGPAWRTHTIDGSGPARWKGTGPDPSPPVCSAGARCRSNGHSRVARRTRRGGGTRTAPRRPGPRTPAARRHVRTSGRAVPRVRAPSRTLGRQRSSRPPATASRSRGSTGCSRCRSAPSSGAGGTSRTTMLFRGRIRGGRRPTG